MFNIGAKPSTPIRVAGRNRVPDGLNSQALSEIKNVGDLEYSTQLRDYLAIARRMGIRFDSMCEEVTMEKGY